MSSYSFGKRQVIDWVKSHFPQNSTCLDVGPCDGVWYNYLGDYLTMDAVEIFKPYIDGYGLRSKYRNVYCSNITDFSYDHYDLIIFGDVLEHMTVEQAQKVLDYAKPRSNDILIAVPFLYHQGECRGNPFERHIQDDLTPELFDCRYPGFQQICHPVPNYAYYSRKFDCR